jgi:hypothetical protein
MKDLFELLKKNKPNASDNTLRTYASILKNLYLSQQQLDAQKHVTKYIISK